MFSRKIIQFFNWLFPHPTQGHRTKFIMESEQVGDDFEIWVDLPDLPPSELGALPVLIFTDANLPSSRHLNPIVKEMREAGTLPPMILVGISHHDSFLRKRNRDLIQGRREVNGEFISRKKNVGQATRFYGFIAHELIPRLRKEYAVSENWTYCGHSLGGSAGLYFMLQSEPVFNNYITTSPSVWLYRRNMLKIAGKFLDKGGELQGNVFLSAGSLEAFNLILYSTKAYQRFLENEQTDGLKVKMDVYPWRNHFTSAKPGIRNGLKWLAEIKAFE